MTLFFVSVAVALSVSGICSLMEAALLSMTPLQVAQLSMRHPRVGAIWQNFKTNIERPIAVILILNTAAHTVGASVAGAQFSSIFGGRWIWLFSLIFTFLMVQYTEILPKTLGVRFNREVARVIATPLLLAISVLTPFIRVIHFLNRPFEMGRRRGQVPATLEEISALAGLARLSNLIGSHQERIIKGAARLSTLRADQVMIPIEQVTFISTKQRLADAIVTAHMDPHTRFPICAGDDRDNIVGYVNFKEMVYLMRTNPQDPSLEGISRPVHFATPDESADKLLKVFVEQHVHMAIVRDAAGKALGLVTLEDIVEELVGELEDEFDRLPRMVHPLTSGMWMIGGGVPAVEVAAKTGKTLPEPAGTISAWLIRRMGTLPKVNETYRDPLAPDLEFMIRRTRRGRIFEVAVTRRA